MAVKPITNKQVVDKSTIRRDEQVSFRGTTARGGNGRESITPGLNFDKNYSILLKDIDTSIMNYIKEVIRPTIKEANENIKVPVLYGNEERWVNVRKRGVLRDKNNTIILPVIVLKRTSVEKNTELSQGFEHDVQRKYAEVLRKSQWSKDNRYDRFSVQTNKKPSYESLVTTMPNFVNITYEFVLLTSYMEQMNVLIEEFLEYNNNYWGSGTDYKFLSTLESISDASEMTADAERIIKSTFSLVTKAYLLPEYTNSVITNKISQIQKKLTPSRVVFGFEGDATDEQVRK
tara:strand:+ start:287 stop:1153 length:867 start_codon:yes stop_codon:yes gene_type:complete